MRFHLFILKEGSQLFEISEYLNTIGRPEEEESAILNGRLVMLEDPNCKHGFVLDETTMDPLMFFFIGETSTTFTEETCNYNISRQCKPLTDDVIKLLSCFEWSEYNKLVLWDYHNLFTYCPYEGYKFVASATQKGQ